MGNISDAWKSIKNVRWQTIFLFLILIVNGLVLVSMTGSMSDTVLSYIKAYHIMLLFYTILYMLITLGYSTSGNADHMMILRYTILYILLFINAFYMLNQYANLNTDLQDMIRSYVTVLFLFFSLYIGVNMFLFHVRLGDASNNVIGGKSKDCLSAQYYSNIALFVFYVILGSASYIFGVFTKSDIVAQAWLVLTLIYVIMFIVGLIRGVKLIKDSSLCNCVV